MAVVHTYSLHPTLLQLRKTKTHNLLQCVEINDDGSKMSGTKH